ncbi:hypothetical protein LM604_00145 [Candidatus Acetothermia bacterium]|nr:hypothetical protein [Candidatus Acetothermia bacterium]
MIKSASRWLSVGVLVALLSTGIDNGIGQPPPPPAPIVPNASLVTAHVLKYSIWNGRLLSAQPESTLYSLVLEVLTSEPVSTDLPNLIKAGEIIEAFANEVLSPELFGKRIKAVVRLMGDERGQRFWIRDISIVESKP